jgi:hypothetical protein
MVMVQGVRQLLPSDDRASALAGFDCISNTVVSGFGFNESGIELQAAIPRPHIIRANARSSLISAFRRSRIVSSIQCAVLHSRAQAPRRLKVKIESARQSRGAGMGPENLRRAKGNPSALPGAKESQSIVTNLLTTIGLAVFEIATRAATST